MVTCKHGKINVAKIEDQINGYIQTPAHHFYHFCVFDCDCVSTTCVYLPICAKKFDRFACCAPSIDNFDQSGLTSECRKLRAFRSRPPVDLSWMAYLHLSPFRVVKQFDRKSKMQSTPLLLMRAADKRLPNQRASMLILLLSVSLLSHISPPPQNPPEDNNIHAAVLPQCRTLTLHLHSLSTTLNP